MSLAPNLQAALRVAPGRRVDLGDVDPGATFGFEKEGAKLVTDGLLDRLTDLQERLWAEQRRTVLIVLQGIDAAGKDGTIRTVMAAFNPQGCPSPLQGADARGARPRLPVARPQAHARRKGEIAIFNRSHYEDVLVVRVHDLVPKAVWRSATTRSTRSSELLADDRHDHRQVLPVHRPGRAARAVPGAPRRPDEALEVRARRPRGAQALGRLHRGLRGRALERCSTERAPWYVIPANRKWFRNLAVAVDRGRHARRSSSPQYPPRAEDLPAELVIE